MAVDFSALLGQKKPKESPAVNFNALLKTKPTQPRIDLGINQFGTQTSTPAFIPQPEVSVTDVIKEIPTGAIKTAKAIGRFGRDVGQSILTSSASLGGTKFFSPVVDFLSDKIAKKAQESDFANAFTEDLSRRLFGDIKDPRKGILGETRQEELQPADVRAKNLQEKAKVKGKELIALSKTPTLNKREKIVAETLGSLLSEQASGLSKLAVFGVIGLDLTPFGGERKGIETAIKNANTLSDATTVLKNAKVSEDLVKFYAPEIVKVKNTKDAKALVDALEKVQKTTKKVDTSALARPTAPVRPIEKIKPTVTPKVSKELQPLAKEAPLKTEARQAMAEGKSLEEFVKGTRTIESDRIFWKQQSEKSIKEIEKGQISVVKSPTSNKWTYNIGDGRFSSSPFSTKSRTLSFADTKRSEALNYLKNNFVEDNTKGLKDILPTKSQLETAYKEVKGVSTKPVQEISQSKAQRLLQEQPAKQKKVLQKDFVPLTTDIPQRQKVSKTFTKEGRILVDDTGKQVFPKPIKETPTPLDSPALKADIEKRVGKEIDKQTRNAQKALANVGKKHGKTEIIIASLKKQGVSPSEINNIYLEDGTRLVDTVKIKREQNGVLSAVITKNDIKEIETGFKGTKLNEKWIPTKTSLQKIKEAGRTGKLALLDYYELPQLFFDRTGLRDKFYEPIREARRNASDMKTGIYNQFVKAGLMKRQGWFTADRFNISKKESENIGRYYLARQGKGGSKTLEQLSKKEQDFVKLFDKVIKDNEERFYKVAKLNGKNPGKVENYAPIMTSDDFKLAQETGDLDFIFRKHPAFFSTKQREVKVPFELYELDYRRVAIRWIDQLSNFNHLGEVGPQVKYLANADEFKDIVGDRVSNTTNKWLQGTFNPQVLSPAEKGLRFFRQTQAIASLGLNLGSVIKQVLTQIPLTIIEKAPPKLQSKFAKDFGIKVADLPSITERKGNAAIMDMQEGFRRLVVGPLTAFDQKNAQLSLNRLLDKNYKKFLKEGKSITPEAQAQILKKSQDVLDMWYGGMTSEQLPLAFRSELGKTVNMFIMPLTSQLNGFFYSVAKAKGINKAEKLAEVLASAVAIAYLEQVITNMSPQWSDRREMLKDTLSSLAGNIPLVSQVVFAFRTDQPLSPSPVASAVGRLVQQLSKAKKDQADAVDVAFAFAELFGLPKQFRRTTQGVEVVMDGGVRDKNGELLAPVKGTDEYLRAFIRGKYGTIATQDWIRNIGIKTEQRRWFVPEVEFLQNGDYERKAELYNTFDKETKDELRAELSEGQQKKLDKALKTSQDKKQKSTTALDRLHSLGGTSTPALDRLRAL